MLGLKATETANTERLRDTEERIVGVIRSRKMKLVGCGERMGKLRNAHEVLVGKQDGKEYHEKEKQLVIDR
jgi:hypothetical protein